jgi:hypothetical protein
MLGTGDKTLIREPFAAFICPHWVKLDVCLDDVLRIGKKLAAHCCHRPNAKKLIYTQMCLLLTDKYVL